MCAEGLYDPKSSALVFQFESWALHTSSSLCPCAVHVAAAKHRDESQEKLEARPIVLQAPLIVHSLRRKPVIMFAGDDATLSGAILASELHEAFIALHPPLEMRSVCVVSCSTARPVV